MENREAYENLANAIIIQAYKDFKYGDQKLKRESIRFFSSEWYTKLTSIDSVLLLTKGEDLYG
jgi:hypothetical protein